MPTRLIPFLIFLIIFPFVARTAVAQPSTHEELVQFFFDWRGFERPDFTDGVPDYSRAAMIRQRDDLPVWQTRLAGFDTTGWSVTDQVDWYLIWAEMNGLDFAHRIKRPWERDPAFYVWFYSEPTDVPEREGPNIAGAIELPNYTQPLSNVDAAEIAARLRLAPEVFDQAQMNLTGNARDLWVLGTRTIRGQGDELERFAVSIESSYPDLARAAREARRASDAFADWLASRAESKTGISGVGKDHYTWNLRNVHLLPYDWKDVEETLHRELARAHASLRLEENRNRALPPLVRINNASDYDQRLNDAVDDFVTFLENEDILSIRDYMGPALRARIGSFTPLPATGLRGFFNEIGYRAPIVMRTHQYHWIDLARMREEPNPSPIRATPLLYNIFDGRAEGMATGMEEMMMHAGLLDDNPRARELVWILLAQRCARGLGGLYQHGRKMNFDEATHFASKWTPRGYLPANGGTIQFEEQFYLQQPAYGISYVIGKIEIEKLIAAYSRERKTSFSIRAFMDAFNRAGVIPVSLIYWELTGDKSMLNAAIAGREAR